MALEISEVRPEDYEDITSLWKEAGGDPNWQPVVDGTAEFNSVLSLVVRDQKKLVAMLLCHQDGEHGYGHQMAIREPYRRPELAKLLVDKALQKLRSQGIHKCRLHVSEASQPQAFWETVKWSDYRHGAGGVGQRGVPKPSADASDRPADPGAGTAAKVSPAKEEEAGTA